jgi:hypothetical protein
LHAYIVAAGIAADKKAFLLGDARPRQHYPNKRPPRPTVVASEMGQRTKPLAL